jgi:adenylate kinase family enzyme
MTSVHLFLGLSGSGKTTFAKWLESQPGSRWYVFDVDSWWQPDEHMPRVMRPDGRSVKLYDHPDAIRWHDMKNALLDVIADCTKNGKGVIVTSFYAPVQKIAYLELPDTWKFIVFNIPASVSISRRQQSKRGLLSDESLRNDEWMMTTYAIPLYKSWIDDFLAVHGNRGVVIDSTQTIKKMYDAVWNFVSKPT